MNLSDDFIRECDNLKSLCQKIVDMLPEDPADAKTCISMVVDMWSRKNARRSSQTWMELYEVAMILHNEMGDCK